MVNKILRLLVDRSLVRGPLIHGFKSTAMKQSKTKAIFMML